MVCSYCRTAVQPGSRFCNACGTPLAAGAQPAQQPTQQWQQAPQPTQQWQDPHAGAAQQTVAWDPSQVNGQFAAAAVPGKKPWLILALLLALVAGAVGVAAVAITRAGKPLTAQNHTPVPAGSGVVQTVNPGMPQGPGLVTSQSGVPSSGNPVTANTKGKDDMAPSVMMSQGGNPNAPSVTAAQQPRIPSAPSVTGATPRVSQPGTPMTAQPQAPAPPDNADFDRYLKWLRFVENERAGLRAQGETVAFQQIEGYLNAMITMSDPDPSADRAIENFQAQNTQMLNTTVRAINAFRANVIQSRRNLLVPADCKALDQYYMAALDKEIETTATLMSAMANRNIGQIRSIGTRGVGSIDMNLGMANKELKKAYEGRGLNQLFTIETGGTSSMLGGLTGIGGLK
jgi:hypothetical protein